VHIHESILRDDLSGSPKQLLGATAIQPVDAVNDLRFRLGKALGQRLGEEQVLGGARAAALSQQPSDRAVTRATVGQRPDGLYEVDE